MVQIRDFSFSPADFPWELAIGRVSTTLTSQLQAKIDQKTKPHGALGRLETLALRIGLIQNSLTPDIRKPAIIIFAGDHGIAEAQVSAYPQTVTAQMVANFLAGGAAISVFARQHGLALQIVDAGVKTDIGGHGSGALTERDGAQLLVAKIAAGTGNFLNGPAMTAAQCAEAVALGAELVQQHADDGCNCIGFGEMGIGNSSSAALLMHALTGVPLAECVGSGTGLNPSQLQHKIEVLQQVLHCHAGVSQPLPLLTAFGGFETAMMVGAYLKAAELGLLIMVDGFIAGAALLVAHHIEPRVTDYCVFSHVSAERGHRALLAHLGAQALLDLELRLGEGSGIALAYPLLQSAVLFLNEMASFADAGVDREVGR